MQVKQSMGMVLICAVIFVQFVCLVAAINNFTSLYKRQELIASQIDEAETEKSNNLAEINRQIGTVLSNTENQSIVRLFPSEVEKLKTPEEIEEENNRQTSQNIIIIQ